MTFKNHKHTAETKARISETQKRRYREHPELRENIKEARAEYINTLRQLEAAGFEVHRRHLSEEHKAKISATMKGRLPSPQCRAAAKEFAAETKRTKKMLKDLEMEGVIFRKKRKRNIEVSAMSFQEKVAALKEQVRLADESGKFEIDPTLFENM